MQPSQGVGQRLPGALEINSPGISGESIFRDLEQPGGEPAPQPEAAQPGQVPEGPLGEVFEKINTRLLFAASKKRGWQPPIDDILTLINLKSQVILYLGWPSWTQTLSGLKTEPAFWSGRLHFNKKKWEYRPETLTNRLAQLDREGTKSPFSGNFSHCAKNIHKTDPLISEMFYCLSFIFQINIMDRDWYKVTYCS